MKESLETLLITGEDIQSIVRSVGLDNIMDELIEGTYDALINYDNQESIMPVRSGFNYSKPSEGLVEWMPIRSISKDEILIKIVGYHPRNPDQYSLPTIISSVSRYDTRTGHLKALLDGVLPTSLRTGAIAAVASKLFGYAKSESLGLIGCGAQAITQLHAISRVYDISKVYYCDSDPQTEESFVDRCQMLNLNCQFISSDIDTIIRESDIVSTATSIGIGEGPLYDNLVPREWLHINAIGSDFPGKFEVPLSHLKQSYVCPDWITQAKIEGECQQLSDEYIGEDLTDCLKKANELSHLRDNFTVFDSTGLALQDLVVSDILLKYAKSMHLGRYVKLENTSLDEKNPYSFLTQTAKVEK